MSWEPSWRVVERNGSIVSAENGSRLFALDAVPSGYAVAQIDDYGGTRQRGFRWRPGTSLSLRARFSDSAENLIGTAGFGFWNAPFADPTVTRLALPQATWFFFASKPNYLPFPRSGPALGWFAGTVDAGTGRALRTVPLAPVALLLNQSTRLRERVWPWVRQRLAIAYTPLAIDLTQWHRYRLDYRPNGCVFYIDDNIVLHTPHAPHGPLGFVCWIDNQYMILTPRGRIGAGVVPTIQSQWMEVADLALTTIA
jgi:hypothetical protein